MADETRVDNVPAVLEAARRIKAVADELHVIQGRLAGIAGQASFLQGADDPGPTILNGQHNDGYLAAAHNMDELLPALVHNHDELSAGITKFADALRQRDQDAAASMRTERR